VSGTGRLTVLHLVTNRWWTGSAEPTLRLVLGLRARGHRALLALVAGDRFETKAREAGIQPVEELRLDIKSGLAAIMGDARRLGALVRREGVDIVHAHHSHDHWLGWWGHDTAALIRTFHNERAVRRAWPDAALYRRSDALVAVSRRIEVRLREAGISSDRLYRADGVVDAARFVTDAPGALKIREEFEVGGAPLVGCVARLAAGRGHEVLIEGFGLLSAGRRDARLLLVGKGERRDALVDLVKRLGLERRVFFAGYRDSDLPAVLGALDVFVLMGAGSDDSCRAALEAMAAGRPVLAARVGALPDAVVHGETGLLLESPTPAGQAPRAGSLHVGPARRSDRDAVSRDPREAARATVKVIHLVSCSGWSSDAYWAARVCRELGRAGHEATLVCRRGTEERVMSRARGEGAARIETLSLRSGLRPFSDLRDLRQLCQWLPDADAVHVHRSKEHWLAALANRVSGHRRPLVRTRHIVQPIRPHALNRWLYGRATDLIVTVSEAIRRQCLAAGLASSCRVVALPGGADGERFRPGGDSAAIRRELGLPAGLPIVGLLSGFRVMKGHAVVVEAAQKLAGAGRTFHLVFAGQGPFEAAIRESLASAGLGDRATFLGFVENPARVLGVLDIALYPPLESDGMSRALFEYLAAGRAVIASRVGVAAEVLTDDESALLVPAGDAPELARALARLLDDDALRRRLGERAAAMAHERLTSARVTASLIQHYQRLSARS
jgi:glycosyltransferase involved in cell wall biosynthesis